MVRFPSYRRGAEAAADRKTQMAMRGAGMTSISGDEPLGQPQEGPARLVPLRPALATARRARRCGTQPRRRLHQAEPGARYAALCGRFRTASEVPGRGGACDFPQSVKDARASSRNRFGGWGAGRTRRLSSGRSSRRLSPAPGAHLVAAEIGRASCRERVYGLV